MGFCKVIRERLRLKPCQKVSKLCQEIASTSIDPTIDPPVSEVDRYARFEDVFDTICEELLQKCRKEGLPLEAVEWYRANLVYNLRTRKLNPGVSVTDTVEILKGRPLSKEEYFDAAVLGWSVELLNGYFLVSDEIMDTSRARRGNNSWYLTSAPTITKSPTASSPSTQNHLTVGMVAINDGAMLYSAIYSLIHTHFHSHPRYVDLMNLFLDFTYKTEMGQLIDSLIAPQDITNLGPSERNRLSATYKTAYYSLHLPVALAMLMCNIPESYIVKHTFSTTTIKPYDLALSILLPLGEYTQMPGDSSLETGSDTTDMNEKAPSETDEEDSANDHSVEVKDDAMYKHLNVLIDSIPEDGIVLDQNRRKAEHGGIKRQMFRRFLEQRNMGPTRRKEG
ncbi:hypothetical protein H0H92_013466 [Tricholoma furcatifolium]|nr:hypothetical protein H0H92_013466 [Tricholoma furcatifolium]